ncbi:hypothetical protein [Inconstantimicrobium mannanitabidum]|uniref:Uncharacterized protein n=1 Tax=Inconstantimicrobium mannanitabidum TaxID=1604901 RepID=A0ACB5R7Q3_9CLOT|nr:hypothetical protein [Clostridium sp. TW13]GKX65105.1 hypothetical protein rsdtw13_03630 [Clostridium sp. TW13]
MLKSEFKNVLLKIDFSKRAEKLTQEHSFDRDNTFEDYDNNEIIMAFSDIGYKAKYDKNENFFKVTESVLNYRIQVHACLKYGFIELGWYLFSQDKYYDGDTWSSIKRELDGEENLLRDLVFHNYEELKEILKEVFSMYEDFKRELCSLG